MAQKSVRLGNTLLNAGSVQAARCSSEAALLRVDKVGGRYCSSVEKPVSLIQEAGGTFEIFFLGVFLPAVHFFRFTWDFLKKKYIYASRGCLAGMMPCVNERRDVSFSLLFLFGVPLDQRVGRPATVETTVETRRFPVLCLGKIWQPRNTGGRI